MPLIPIHINKPSVREAGYAPSADSLQKITNAQNTVHPDFTKLEQQQNPAQDSSPKLSTPDTSSPSASDTSVKPNMEVIAPSSTILGVSKPIFFAGVGVIACVAIGGGIWYYIKNKKQ